MYENFGLHFQLCLPALLLMVVPLYDSPSPAGSSAFVGHPIGSSSPGSKVCAKEHGWAGLKTSLLTAEASNKDHVTGGPECIGTAGGGGQNRAGKLLCHTEPLGHLSPRL